MALPFLQRSQVYAARLLHQAGLTISQIPDAVEVARTTVETWFEREINGGNAQEALMVLKGQVQEKGPKIMYDQLKELVLVKLIIHLGLRSTLATNVAALILPFILKRVYEQVRQNKKIQTWWYEQNWKQHLPSKEGIKTKFKEVRESLRPARPNEDQPLFI